MPKYERAAMWWWTKFTIGHKLLEWRDITHISGFIHLWDKVIVASWRDLIQVEGLKRLRVRMPTHLQSHWHYNPAPAMNDFCVISDSFQSFLFVHWVCAGTESHTTTKIVTIGHSAKNTIVVAATSYSEILPWFYSSNSSDYGRHLQLCRPRAVEVLSINALYVHSCGME